MELNDEFTIISDKMQVFKKITDFQGYLINKKVILCQIFKGNNYD